MKIKNLIVSENIFFINEKEKNAVINFLVNSSKQKGYVANIDEFRKFVFDRENIVGTGIGCGIAIPHVKMATIDNFFILIGILRQSVDWDAIDDKPVKIAFMIGGPNNDQKKYLEILSGLTTFFKDEQRREKLFNINSKDEILQLFEDF